MSDEEYQEKIKIQKLLIGYQEQKRHLKITNDQLRNEILRLEDAVRNLSAQRELAAANKTSFYLEVKQLLDELEDNSRQMVEITSKNVLTKKHSINNKPNQGLCRNR